MVWLEIIFWVSAGLALYTLVGYPVLGLLLAAVVRRGVNKGPFTPRVSVIIAAYNEEAVIGEKIRQTLGLEYPPEQMEIVVASDGSTDRTDEVVRSFADARVKLCRVEGRQGKTAALNGALGVATGEILVFSDATTVYHKGALRELAANFHDPTVGCVAGRVLYRYGKDTASRGLRLSERITLATRRAESRFGSQTSVSGAMHAIRRSLCAPMNPDYSPDVVDVVRTVVGGYRAVYESEAISWEESRRRLRDEFRCRVRMGAQSTLLMPYILRELVRHGKFGFALQMISHKILRWYLWLTMSLAFVSSVCLACSSRVYGWAALAQGCILGVAMLGMLGSVLKRAIPMASTLAFFLVCNAGMCAGTIRYLTGNLSRSWEPVR